jgi:hypothetical protein
VNTLLANTLEMRGFLVKPIDNYIYFSLGNKLEDFSQLERLLASLDLKFTCDGNKLFILEDEIQTTILNQILWYPARNHESDSGAGWYGWKYFIKRNHGPKIKTFVLETGVALFVKAISAAGIVTDVSCDGHGRRAPIISFCGKQNAAWFKLLFESKFRDTNFHYEWYFKDPLHLSIIFTARSKDGRWDLEKVLEDTLLMARSILQEANELSKMKKEIFGGNYKTTRKIVREMDFEEHFQWMKQRYDAYLEHKEGEMIGGMNSGNAN